MKNTISLNQNTLFKRLYYRGRSFNSPYFVLYCMQSGTNNKQINRLGLTVSKKIGNAVKRNIVRRWIYEAFRLYEPQLKTGYNIVIVAKSAALDGDFHKIHRTIGGVLKKAELFSQSQ